MRPPVTVDTLVMYAAKDPNLQDNIEAMHAVSQCCFGRPGEGGAGAANGAQGPCSMLTGQHQCCTVLMISNDQGTWVLQLPVLMLHI